MVSVRIVTNVLTPSPCNCLLSGCSTTYSNQIDFFSGCYEFLEGSSGSVGAQYRGCVGGYVCETKNGHLISVREATSVSSDSRQATLQGIFDLTSCSDGHHLVASCTDGSVRLLVFQDGFFEESVFPVHGTMLTSCSPFHLSPGEVVTRSKWICTAHQGAVVVYDPVAKIPISNLEGHDYDAWCSAITGSETALTGGDDGKLKWWDTRHGKGAVSKMRFDAGVVSIAPIATSGTATTYSLVGSYDENLYVVDSRLLGRPLASVYLGGGVWRCSRQLLFDGLSKEEEAGLHFHRWVQPSNTLAIPVMQRGVALVRYDIGASEDKTFSLLRYLHQERDSAYNDGFPTNALFYDCAVLCRSFSRDTDKFNDFLTLAACDFYNRTISLWEIDGIHRCG